MLTWSVSAYFLKVKLYTDIYMIKQVRDNTADDFEKSALPQAFNLNYINEEMKRLASPLNTALYHPVSVYISFGPVLSSVGFSSRMRDIANLLLWLKPELTNWSIHFSILSSWSWMSVSWCLSAFPGSILRLFLAGLPATMVLSFTS